MTAPTEPRQPGGGELVINLFAGPGGWCEALRMAGFRGINAGFELDPAACRTGVANGHHRVRVDVAAYSIAYLIGRVLGLIGSPPCKTFSGAGDGAGALLLEILATAMTRMARGQDPASVLEQVRRDATAVLLAHADQDEKLSQRTAGERAAWALRNADMSALVLQPLRYALDVRPRWIALEQVERVQPIWDHLAAVLRGLGYSVWTGVLSTERYGVAETRRRAILLASLDQPVYRPAVTHQAYRADRAYDTAGGLFPALPTPVGWGEALGWDREAIASVEMYERQANGGRRPADAPSLTITSALDNGNLRFRWLRNGNQANAAVREVREPAGTLFFGARTNAVDLVADDGSSRRIAPAEAGLIQSFPAGYRFVGTKSQQLEQIGNAVPPVFGAHMLRPLLAHLSAAAAA